MKNILAIFVLVGSLLGGELELKVGIEAVNDTIDILKIKESEFSSSTSGFDSLGDMTGVDLGLKYQSDRFALMVDLNQKRLDYSGSTLINDFYQVRGRYAIYDGERFGLSLEGGYETNKAKDLYIKDIKTINDTLKRVFPSQTIVFTNDMITYSDDGSTSTVSLAQSPYVALINNKDEAFFIKAIASIKGANSTFDIFGGYKQIKIQNNIDSSIAYEDGLKDDIADGDLSVTYKHNREDGMAFGGVAFGYDWGRLNTSIKYQYNQMYRISCLKETDTNHIVDVDFLYSLTPNFGVFLGGHIMSNQFNGEIHYLYTKYTKTTFDHKYGYARSGIVMKF